MSGNKYNVQVHVNHALANRIVKLSDDLKNSFNSHAVGQGPGPPTRADARADLTSLLWRHRELLDTADLEEVWNEVRVRSVMES